MNRNETSSQERPCHPLKSIDELLAFRDFCCKFETVKNHSDSDERYRMPLPNRPRVLLCHDFAGGYLEDRYYCTQSLADKRKASGGYKAEKDYCFQHWNRIDIFVYFSHNFITVPPCKWIQQAHSNGVKILGTIIIEWNRELIQQLLMTPRRKDLIKNLVDLCVCANFDGWLFNMEVSLHRELIPSLRELITDLRSQLAEKQPGSLVLWYDSLTTSGSICYRDELTPDNKPFFDDCDGIFLNYGWTHHSLERSKARAGGRVYDVYAGIDVFGRGTGYEAGFNTPQVVKDVTARGLSTAIFAPGWVLECNDIKHFEKNQEKFWGVLPVLR